MGHASETPSTRQALALSEPESPTLARWVRAAAALSLATAATLVLLFVHRFALTRFFTVDEYQWGHATWLVSVGSSPWPPRAAIAFGCCRPWAAVFGG